MQMGATCYYGIIDGKNTALEFRTDTVIHPFPQESSLGTITTLKAQYAAFNLKDRDRRNKQITRILRADPASDVCICFAVSSLAQAGSSTMAKAINWSRVSPPSR
jgi:hypothetical protein